MNILIPMGGLSSRFKEAGIKTNKALLDITDRHSGRKLPMVICALQDIPWINNPRNKLICVNKLDHSHNGLEKKISNHFKNPIFIHDHVMLDQAFGCFLAREYLQSNEELFIGACDNGFDLDLSLFNKLKKSSDVIMFSHSNNSNIASNPYAHSWAKLHKDGETIKKISLKKPVSKNYMDDHATTGMFWFKRSNDFLKNLEKMIWKNDTLDNKYYVDKVLQYCIDDGLKVKFLDVNYLCWGTPKDYYDYENRIDYWKKFYKKNKWISKRP
jgi:dTDP-glucose pyrophosphorylase